MTETTTYIRTHIYCNQCEEELEFYEDSSKSDLPNCNYCGSHFNAGEEIECEAYHGDEPDGESKHWHKKCYLQKIEEDNKCVETLPKLFEEAIEYAKRK